MLEVFQALKIAYFPKKKFFDIEEMIAGTQRAALDYLLLNFCHQYQLNLLKTV